MKHRFLALILAVLMMVAAIPAFATETETTVPETTEPERPSNYCGESIVWSYSGGVLTITGAGTMYDFEDGAPWEAHKSEIKKVIISGGITYIGAYSFNDYDALTDVEFGKDVYEIGERAFFSCDGLTKIYLPASFKIFGVSSFMGCTKLKEIHCEGKFPSFRQNCLWDTYAKIYFPASRPWSVEYIAQLEEAFHGRIEFLASDGSDPYDSEAAKETTQATTEATTEPSTEAPATVPPTTEASTEPETEPSTEPVTEAPEAKPEQSQTPVPVPQDPEQTPQKSGSNAGLMIVGAVAVFLLGGALIFGNERKRRRRRRRRRRQAR